MKPLVIYHANCYDGLLAAYAAWLKLGDNAEYLPMSYDDCFDHAQFIDRDVYFVDFSAKYATLRKLAIVADHITIIDHHKTAEADLTDNALPSNVQIIFDMNKAGCVLAAEYFLDHVPWFFNYIGDRDIWKFEYPETKEFCAGFSAQFPLATTVFEDLASQLTYMTIDAMGLNAKAERDVICDKGRLLLEYRNTLMEGWIAHLRTPNLSLHNFSSKVGVLTGIPKEFVSEMGHLVLKCHPGLSAVVMLSIIYTDGKAPLVSCSWRSEDTRADVSEIAKVFGGGGHRNAAGCAMTLELAMTNNLI